MKIIDSHVHLFERFAGMAEGQPIVSDAYGRVRVGNTVSQFLPPSFEHSRSSVETYRAFMDWIGIEKAVVLQNVLYGYHNSYLAEIVAMYPNTFRATALVDVVRGKEVVDELNGYLSQMGFIGLKIEVNTAFQCNKEMRLDSETLLPIWGLCNDLKKAVVLHISREFDLDSLESLVKRYPRIVIIVCHLGAEATLGKGIDESRLDYLFDLVKKHKTVFTDIASLPHYLGESEYPFPNSSALISRACDRIGAEKLLWGTDYPGMLSMATYKQLITMVTNYLPVADSQKELIMGKNAEQLFWK
jgi:predicted TIM-barrel fold metal-dependent hydrolase